MTEVQQFVIPTLSKTKVSRNLSYPIGAKPLSVALASTVQLPELKLHFYAVFVSATRKGKYKFLHVEYANDVRPAYVYKRSLKSPWEIVVQPVPRVHCHRIKQYIIETALAKIRDWLDERAGLSQYGNDILGFFYDDGSDEFTVKQSTHLEPIRHRGR